MLCGPAAMVQASVLDGLSFDPFSFKQDGLTASEVDIGRGEIGDALMVSQVIVMSDEAADVAQGQVKAAPQREKMVPHPLGKDIYGQMRKVALKSRLKGRWSCFLELKQR